MASFSAFNLSSKMVSALNKLGYQNPSPVQENVIPKALRGLSLVCQSATGSGKTHSYLVPIIEKIDSNLPRTQAIVIAPSRELARQVFEFAKPFERFYPHLKVRLFTSETERSQNSEGLSVPPHLIIGTPGRLKDILLQSSEINLNNLRTLVLDEADMLMDMGYFDDIDAIYTKLTSTPQVMVFSATLHQGLKDKLSKYIGSDFLYESEEIKTAASVAHHFIDIKHAGTIDALKRFLKVRNPYLCLVFASKKTTVDQVYEGLKDSKINVIRFSGDLSTRERKKTVRLIKENRYQVIVCSDLLSRGIDIEDVTDVISVDLPSDSEFYFHRAGRTGRFDKSGDSWIFYNADTVKSCTNLMEKGGFDYDFKVLKLDTISDDPVGLAPKKKLATKKELPMEELKEIRKAKAKIREKNVTPMYKKKREFAINKVKQKYKRKAIQKAVHRSKSQSYRGFEGDDDE